MNQSDKSNIGTGITSSQINQIRSNAGKVYNMNNMGNVNKKH